MSGKKAQKGEWKGGKEEAEEEREGKRGQHETLACSFSWADLLHGNVTECLIMSTFAM